MHNKLQSSAMKLKSGSQFWEALALPGLKNRSSSLVQARSISKRNFTGKGEVSGCLSTTEIIISPTAGDKRSGDLLPQKKNFLRINLSVLSRGTSKATPHQRMRWLTLWCAQSQVCWRAWVCVRARMWVYVGESERERAWMIGERVRETPEKYLGMEYARPLCRNMLLLSLYLFLPLPWSTSFCYCELYSFFLSFLPLSHSFY